MGALISAALVVMGVVAAAWPQSLGENDTIAAANLSASELQQIIAQVEESAFDTPESWPKELRARRVDLGANPGIMLQGTDLLCGGTGNCQLFVLRHMNDKWISLFDRGEAPLADSVQFGPGVTHGIKDLTITSHLGGAASSRTLFKFDGRRYKTGRVPRA